ncbi:hypothetical protein [Staphylococcus epidermidis]|uniref:hypothetical protein n=1 Tax=Staphylococcus epidermidis TaxID=1282 RepID=UPI000ABFDD1B|nr:hypothetical protein [Staphylococcus epidermidis]
MTKSANKIISIARKEMKHIQNVLNHRPKSINEYSFNTGSNLISNNAVLLY